MLNSDLPTEVFLNVFQRLSQESLKECLYVCKFWNYHVSQIYYQNIILPHCKIPSFVKILTSKNSNNIGRWVKRITFNKSYRRASHTINKIDLHTILSYLPYLKIICLNNPELYSWYLSSINDIEVSSIRFLKQINLTSIPIDQNTVYLYYNTILKFKNSINYLKIMNTQLHTLESNEEFDIVSLLSSLKDLTHLEIFKLNTNQLDFPSLSSILNACNKNLHALTIRDYTKSTDLTIGLTNMNNFLTHLPHLQTRLSTIQLYLTQLLIPYIEYIISSISPTQLNSLLITASDQFLTDWVLGNSADTIDKFASYLGAIENLKFKARKDGFRQGVIIMREDIPNCISSIYNFAEKVINNRPLFREMKMTLNGTHRKPDVEIQVENSRYTNLNITFQDPDWYAADEGIDIMDYISISKRVYSGKWPLNAFQLIKWRQVPISMTDILSIFRYMIKECNYLHHVFITNSLETFVAGPFYAKYHSKDKTNTTYMKKLHEIARTQTALQLNSTKDNIKYISFENMRITSSFIKTMLEDLEIETLRLFDCVFKVDENSNISFDIGQFVSTLIIHLNTRKYNYIFLEIQQGDYSVTYYQSPKNHIHSFTLLPSPKYIYAFSRYYSKNTTVIKIECKNLKQIIITTRHKKESSTSILYPLQDASRD